MMEDSNGKIKRRSEKYQKEANQISKGKEARKAGQEK
jgi:hypothetical protein